MDISSDSTVDNVLSDIVDAMEHASELDTSGTDDYTGGGGHHSGGAHHSASGDAEHTPPPPPPATVNVVASAAGDTSAPATAATTSGTGPPTTTTPAPGTTGEPTAVADLPTATAAVGLPSAAMLTPAQPYTSFGVAPGDGDLLPPRFGGDPKMDAQEWLQDLLDYVEIRRVPKATAAVLLRTRLTGVARKWLDSLPPGLDFNEMARRFRRRFGDNEAARNELLSQFWNRKQGPNEPVRAYIEHMASLARRMGLDNEPLMRQGIIQGLLPDVQRDVKVQRPTTLEALAEAAAIGEANARTNAARARTNDADVSRQFAELRLMVAGIQDAMTSQHRPTTGVLDLNAPTHRPEPTAAATTTTATYRPSSDVASTAAPSTTAGSAPITVNLVMPDTAAAQHGGRGGRGGRGRGRGWRGAWRGRPTTAQPASHQPLNATATSFLPSSGAMATGHHPLSVNAPPCHLCSRRHAEGECFAAEAFCYECGGRGHFARCCLNRQTPTPQQ